MLDHAADRFGSYCESRIDQYRSLLQERMAASQSSGSGGKGKKGQASKEQSAAQRKRQADRFRQAVMRFAEAIRTGEPMGAASQRSGQRRSLRELVRAG